MAVACGEDGESNTKALLIAYDDMQAIYKGMGRPVWKHLGIDAKGRTRVLKVNYRNTAQILGLAPGAPPATEHHHEHAQHQRQGGQEIEQPASHGVVVVAGKPHSGHLPGVARRS